MEDASVVFQSLCFSEDLVCSSALESMHGDLAVLPVWQQLCCHCITVTLVCMRHCMCLQLCTRHWEGFSLLLHKDLYSSPHHLFNTLPLVPMQIGRKYGKMPFTTEL